jgi:hypothetical protein
VSVSFPSQETDAISGPRYIEVRFRIPYSPIPLSSLLVPALLAAALVITIGLLFTISGC